MRTKEEIAVYQKEYRAKNKERMALYQKDYREVNKEKIAAVKKLGSKSAAAVRQKRYQQTPKGRFSDHKRGAKQRGIAFYLTFEQWWGYWEEHWEARGTGADAMCMCRTNDEGAYEVGNVRIDTNANNAKECLQIRWGI